MSLNCYIIIGDYVIVLNSLAADVVTNVNIDVLLPYLQKHHLLTGEEEHHLSNRMYSSVERAQLLLNYLKQKGDRSLQKFLCSLNLANEHVGHKWIADKLDQTMRANGINCNKFCSEECY